MAEEKDTELVIAYFPSLDAAKAAGNEMKEWDKDLKHFELGAISILSMDANGKLKEDKIGVRSGGKGAKWGVIAGAALGILSGGVTLIGGALIGLAAGGIGGSLIHKKIGMTDEDQAKLEQHLKDGGAALGIMLDPEEMEAVVYELKQLDAEVATYNIPQAVFDEVDRIAKSNQVMHDLAEG
ncbi:MAG: DUF1269 domain-containing protein [Anaerolineales bacterium]|nr:DUF1269 domain-containing protein [Anaerolineales bacterium]